MIYNIPHACFLKDLAAIGDAKNTALNQKNIF
jgi:hypothetical protein